MRECRSRALRVPNMSHEAMRVHPDRSTTSPLKQGRHGRCRRIAKWPSATARRRGSSPPAVREQRLEALRVQVALLDAVSTYPWLRVTNRPGGRQQRTRSPPNQADRRPATPQTAHPPRPTVPCSSASSAASRRAADALSDDGRSCDYQLERSQHQKIHRRPDIRVAMQILCAPPLRCHESDGDRQ